MKIYIIGVVAAGKTTFAKALSKDLKIPCFELDSIVYTQNASERYKRTPEEQVREINRIDRPGSWIIEGTYRKSCRCLLDLANRIVFLDPPLRKRLFRIFNRWVRQRLKIEPCNYRPDLNILRCMYQWTFDFERSRPEFTNMLDSYKEKLITISDPREFKPD